MARTNEKQTSFAQRLKEATGCYNISELSQFFEVAYSTVTGWLSDMRIPIAQQNFLRLRGINPDWICTGKGKKYLSQPLLNAEAVSLKIACPLKTDLQRMLKACDHCSAWAAFIQSPSEKQ